MIVRNKVRHFRQLAGMSQLDLSLECGISTQAISVIEKGKTYTSIRIACLIAYILKVKLDDLFWVEE